ncbi:xylulokinase [Microbacterium sp. APC 3898]|uniref:Xylulose kinase n=1 Tax=Planococcus notacanthi TaxID=3035188 RepID=A0ABT7ZMF7_9BACL|nr:MULTISPECIES: xylulokinase [Terrabacteria group]MDN3428344.1 xylulokinase [Planococcus sp. APC 4016]MDN3498949.1 xylulokinase [Microbacterium sp. APC 3898]
MKYVIGVDLGTSAVKILLVDQQGAVVETVSKPYPLIHEKNGYSEQDPQHWVDQTAAGLKELLGIFGGNAEDIEGISFSGQMHGLVLLDENNEVLRPAILWNDTRTTAECQQIYDVIGQEKLLEITKNPALEGFTLPKILWVQKHEPEIFKKVKSFVLPKDYLRYKLTGKLQMELSDAAGTLLLDVTHKQWSQEICDLLELDFSMCPPLVESHEEIGTVITEFASASGLSQSTRVFAGGADNACGAIGAGILEEGKTLCSIGTSGVVLSYEAQGNKDFGGKVHYFNHAAPNVFYTMGVTLAAGYSLSWFKETFAPEVSFDELLSDIDQVPAGSNGLVFTPYLVGERTPHADAVIRGSFIGMDGSHRRKDFARAVLEGITFSLQESISIFRENGKTIDTIVSIGGGAQNGDWLQMQADIFDAKIVRLTSEQGPGMGAAMLAAFGCSWFQTLQECADAFLQEDKQYLPIEENVLAYKKLFPIYQQVYENTKDLNSKLLEFRK